MRSVPFCIAKRWWRGEDLEGEDDGVWVRGDGVKGDAGFLGCLSCLVSNEGRRVRVLVWLGESSATLRCPSLDRQLAACRSGTTTKIRLVGEKAEWKTYWDEVFSPEKVGDASQMKSGWWLDQEVLVEPNDEFKQMVKGRESYSISPVSTKSSWNTWQEWKIWRQGKRGPLVSGKKGSLVSQSKAMEKLGTRVYSGWWPRVWSFPSCVRSKNEEIRFCLEGTCHIRERGGGSGKEILGSKKKVEVLSMELCDCVYMWDINATEECRETIRK